MPEVVDEVAHDGDDAGRVAVHDVLAEADLRAAEDVALIEEEAYVVLRVDEGDVDGEQGEDAAQLTDRAFACGQRDLCLQDFLRTDGLLAGS